MPSSIETKSPECEILHGDPICVVSSGERRLLSPLPGLQEGQCGDCGLPGDGVRCGFRTGLANNSIFFLVVKTH